jgi:surfeit locus 1 family protein
MDGVPGVHLVTPLILEGNSAAVLVDRGWIPIENSSPDSRTQFRQEGTVDLEGIAMPSVPEPGIAWLADPTPDTEEGRLDAWRILNVDRIQDQLPYLILPFFVELSASPEAAGLPQPESGLDLSEGPHLGYAIQWFAFSLIAVAGGVIWLRRTVRRS